jgi:hypothetical protein
MRHFGAIRRKLAPSPKTTALIDRLPLGNFRPRERVYLTNGTVPPIAHTVPGRSMDGIRCPRHAGKYEETRRLQLSRVDVDGVGIEYEVTGDGQPIVLLHGFPDSGRLWRHQVAGLADGSRSEMACQGCSATVRELFWPPEQDQSEWQIEWQTVLASA